MRTIKYFVSGVYKKKGTLINQQQVPTLPFSTGLTVTDIEDTTSPEDICSHIRTETAKFLTTATKQEVKPEELTFMCISLIDSFEQKKK